MGYKEELLKKIETLREYEKLRVTNLDEAYKFSTQLKVRQDYEHIAKFLTNFHARKDGLFPSKESFDKFVSEHPNLVIDNRFPRLSNEPSGEIEIPNIDFKAVFDAVENDTEISKEDLEQAYKNSDPNIRANRHPLEEAIAKIKVDADTLFDENTAKELKESLDYANNEIIAKTGSNVLDDVTSINSILPGIKAVNGFKDFVKSQGLDENVVVNKGSGKSTISGDLYFESNFETYKPFLNMETKIDENYKEKLLTLDRMLKEEGLLEQASGGESGNKEYGLSDYFQKNYALKKAITDHSKLQSNEEKRANLTRINQLANETKDVSARYDRIFNYIEQNFDLENISLSGNLYSGRPADVGEGGIDAWVPNLPPKYDFENTPKVVFLNGFTQLKAACQVGKVSLKEYLDNPNQAYFKGVETVSKNGDKRYYPPRSEENTLGKRLAHTLVCEDVCYPHLAGYNMIGGRALEFLTNTDPNPDNKVSNTIISSINKEYSELFDHSPSKYFGSPYDPEAENIKNLFAFADKEDDLYKVSSHYHNKNAEKANINKQYSNVLKEKSNTPVEQEYRRVMNSMNDFARERKYMFEHPEEFTTIDNSGSSGGLVSHSLGAVLYSGRDYLLDYMKENNLSIASIQDERLRNEVISFITNPVDTLAKNVNAADLNPESLRDIEGNYNSMWSKYKAENANEFFQKFNEFNRKPNGRNVGKSFTKILSDNKGSWWERLRGKTSKEYRALQKIAKEACKEDGQCYGDDKAMYIAAKAYKNYKMPEGTDFNRLSSTSKKRIEFCDSIIDAYEAKEREKQLQNQEVPAVENNNNNIIQSEFQNQLENDINLNKNNNIDKKDIEDEKSNEKDLKDNGIEP